MGLMHGRVQGDCLVILDSFALPVQGTETRVNAGNEALEYMSQYTESTEKVRSIRSSSIHRSTWTDECGLGRQARERDRMVSLSSWIWMLALWYRCIHSVVQPEVPRSIRRCGGTCFSV